MSSTLTLPMICLVADDLELRPLRASDAPALAQLAADPEILHWLPLPSPYTLADATDFCTVVAPQQQESGRGGVWAVTVRGELAGTVDLRRTDWRARTTKIGYWMGCLPAGRATRPVRCSR